MTSYMRECIATLCTQLCNDWLKAGKDPMGEKHFADLTTAQVAWRDEVLVFPEHLATRLCGIAEAKRKELATEYDNFDTELRTLR